MRTTNSPIYFVCYSRQQQHLVERIEAKLAARRRRGEIDLWRDVRNIDAWDQFTPMIAEAIASAAGAVVVVSDSWYASDYIQTHEWPAILARKDRDPLFGIFPLAFNKLDEDDPLHVHNFVNDLRDELLVGCRAVIRDAVLTRLSNQIGAHARSLVPRLGAIFGEVSAFAPRAGVTEVPASQATRDGLRPGLHNVPELPLEFVEPQELDGLCESVMQRATVGISGIHGEGGTGKTVLATA
ncbi:MAG: TIR domain-containing protein, partial [Actinobacteria bacterium]|nr:TIR domain-containing protein [Actinomycetota bacterium]